MISVIVPVYNASLFLPRCIDSIISQTYNDLEILLVDDGSTDGSGVICEEYAKKDDRFKVIHQENGGISKARNIGLKNSQGDYILLADHDDVLHPQMIEILCHLIKSGDYDFSMCYGEKVFNLDDLKERITTKHEPTNVCELSRDSCMKDLFMGGKECEVQYRFIWNKLYKRELLDTFIFSDTASEDTEFNCRVFQNINKAILFKENLYYWIQRRGSTSHQGYNLRYVNVLNSYLLCLNDIPEENEIYRSYCLRRLYRLMLSISYWSQGSASHKVCLMNCKTIRKLTFSEFLRNTYIPIKERIVLLLFNYFPFLYRLFLDFRSLCSKKMSIIN